MATVVPKPSGIQEFDWNAANSAYRAGFHGAALATAVAVAIAESGRDQYASHRNTDGSTDRGPWQINDKAHPDVSNQAALGFDTAAEAAWKISSGGKNWSPWVTYKTRAYLPFMPAAVAAANAASKVGGSSPSPGSAGQPNSSEGVDSGALGSGIGSPTGFPNPLKGIDAIGQFFSAVYDFFFKHNGSLRILYILAGAFLLFMALRIFTSELGGGGSSHPLLPPIAKAVA